MQSISLDPFMKVVNERSTKLMFCPEILQNLTKNNIFFIHFIKKIYTNITRNPEMQMNKITQKLYVTF